MNEPGHMNRWTLDWRSCMMTFVCCMFSEMSETPLAEESCIEQSGADLWASAAFLLSGHYLQAVQDRVSSRLLG